MDLPTQIDWSNGIAGLFVYLNDATGSWFSNMLLIAIFVIFASGFYFARKDFFGGFAIGGFAILVIGALLWAGGFISGVTYTMVVAISIISFASLWIGTHHD